MISFSFTQFSLPNICFISSFFFVKDPGKSIFDETLSRTTERSTWGFFSFRNFEDRSKVLFSEFFMTEIFLLAVQSFCCQHKSAEIYYFIFSSLYCRAPTFIVLDF